MSAFSFINSSVLKPQSTATELKTRLDWGEPALTIIDVRERASYNQSRIQGAISMPLATLVDMASRSLEQERDIYVYGDSGDMTADAANQLRASGYQQVAELTGGLSAWKATQ